MKFEIFWHFAKFIRITVMAMGKGWINEKCRNFEQKFKNTQTDQLQIYGGSQSFLEQNKNRNSVAKKSENRQPRDRETVNAKTPQIRARISKNCIRIIFGHFFSSRSKKIFIKIPEKFLQMK